MYRQLFVSAVVTLSFTFGAHAQTREQKVRDDRKKVEAEGFWIYNDLAKGYAEAKKSGKPMLVVLRCIPCVECVKLDDDLVNSDKRVRPLMEKFVCVRVVSTNGLDLSLFQFDYDQSFAAFLMNADGTIYGRFGTRSHRTSWSDDVSIEGLAKALQGALDLHAKYPENKKTLALKKGPVPEAASPEQFASLKGKYAATLNYEGNVVQSCIHCHQISDAIRTHYRKKKEPIPENALFAYPHPKTIGLILDPKERATVLRAEKDSIAAKAGLKAGDIIKSLGSQPLLSIADVQWVLHRAPGESVTMKADIQRDGKSLAIDLELPKGWKRGEDLSWRAGSWELRRMALGGLLLENATAEDRKKADVPDAWMALKVKHVGQYGAHAAAKNAGFQQGDILVSYDDRTDLRTESELLAYGINNPKPGDRVAVNVIRASRNLKLIMPIQE